MAKHHHLAAEHHLLLEMPSALGLQNTTLVFPSPLMAVPSQTCSLVLLQHIESHGGAESHTPTVIVT